MYFEPHLSLQSAFILNGDCVKWNCGLDQSKFISLFAFVQAIIPFCTIYHLDIIDRCSQQALCYFYIIQLQEQAIRLRVRFLYSCISQCGYNSTWYLESQEFIVTCTQTDVQMLGKNQVIAFGSGFASCWRFRNFMNQ